MKIITLFLSLFLLVDEPYLSSGKKTVHEDNLPFTADFGLITIPNDAAFVMGDNRLNSYDSRSVGPVPIAQVIGKAAKKLAEKR
ncbi:MULTISPECIES: signal peptidase I [Brevibacillus]|nr:MULTISPECIES: signal peptidase I [Brevibacillus]MDR5002433.1 signal peptidase I [Brevibacillus parabrevis]MED2257193.1 signal peptidase I [Brevibacillus parabrevis]